MFELLVFAVKDLKKSLRDQGSDLMIRTGSSEIVIQELVKEVKATHIFTEEEVEYEWARLMETVKGNLAALFVEEGSPKFLTWSTPFYDIKNVGDLPISHQDFKKLKLPVLSPLPPSKLPDVKMNLCWGTLPTLKDLETCKNEQLNKPKDELMLFCVHQDQRYLLHGGKTNQFIYRLQQLYNYKSCALDDGVYCAYYVGCFIEDILSTGETDINVNFSYSPRLKSYHVDRMLRFQTNWVGYMYNRFLKNKLLMK